MRVIHRQSIKPNAVADVAYPIEIDLPIQSTLLSVGLDREGGVSVWYEMDEFQTLLTKKTLWVVGTGHGQVPNGRTFFGTVVQGQFTWHFYRNG